MRDWICCFTVDTIYRRFASCFKLVPEDWRNLLIQLEQQKGESGGRALGVKLEQVLKRVKALPQILAGLLLDQRTLELRD